MNAYTEVVLAASGRAGVIKAILETALLTPEEIRVACQCATDAGVHYAKAPTGRGGAPQLGAALIN